MRSVPWGGWVRAVIIRVPSILADLQGGRHGMIKPLRHPAGDLPGNSSYGRGRPPRHETP